MAGRMKGQLFLVATIIVIMALFSLHSMFTIFSTSGEKAHIESIITEKTIDNIMREYKSVAGHATKKADVNGTAITTMANFSAFIREDAGAESLYVFAVSNASARNISVTVGNYLGERINATLNVTGASSTPAGYELNFLNDKANATREFGWSTEALVNITVNYSGTSGRNVERFILNVSSYNSTAAFFFVTIKEKDIVVRSKETYNRSW